MKQKSYIISYNLPDTRRKYTPLFDAIKKIDMDCFQATESSWLIHSTLSAKEIYTVLESHINKETDYLLVSEAVMDNIQGWMQRTFWDWAKKFKCDTLDE